MIVTDQSQRLQAMTDSSTCPRCAKRLPGPAKFCRRCGVAVISAARASYAPPPPLVHPAPPPADHWSQRSHPPPQLSVRPTHRARPMAGIIALVLVGGSFAAFV